MQTLNGYQIKALSTAQYPNVGHSILYPLVGLCNEVGELIGKFNACLPDQGRDSAIPAEVAILLQKMELTGLALGRVKKLCRDKETLNLDNNCISGNVEEPGNMGIKLKEELGDVLWYISVLAFELKLSLEEIATANNQKLELRQSEGLIRGDGEESERKSNT